MLRVKKIRNNVPKHDGLHEFYELVNLYFFAVIFALKHQVDANFRKTEQVKCKKLKHPVLLNI
jgi:hypothetical protein